MSSLPSDEILIRAAIDAAGLAGADDVPIGAVIVDADGRELARAANARESLGDPTAHAEILALRARLNQIYVQHTGKTLEVIEQALERDRFFTADEAKAFGLIDEVVAHRPTPKVHAAA